MSWEDRLQVAKYISPSGAEFEFIYETVTQEVEKKTTEFTYPDVDGAYIQDLGRAGRRFPFTLFFSGEDHDIQADNFLLALEETGIGKLEHPLYGDRNVVPTGSITRVDDLTSNANQSAFSVVFSETIVDIVYPSDFKGQEKQIRDLSNNLTEQSGDEFASAIKTDNISEGINLTELGESSSAFINESYSEFVTLNSQVNSSFISISSSFSNNSLNILNDPSGVMQQASLLTRIPSLVETTADLMFSTYETSTRNLLGKSFTPDGSNNPSNDFLLNNVLVSASITGLCEGLLNSEITTRPQGVLIAENLATLYKDSVSWRDENTVTLGLIDTPNSYASLLEVVTRTIGYLISESFNLPREIIVILQNERNLIEFLSSVGLDVESNIDNFIQWNNLTADEIELLPKDKEIVYYV